MAGLYSTCTFAPACHDYPGRKFALGAMLIEVFSPCDGPRGRHVDRLRLGFHHRKYSWDRDLKPSKARDRCRWRIANPPEEHSLARLPFALLTSDYSFQPLAGFSLHTGPADKPLAAMLIRQVTVGAIVIMRHASLDFSQGMAVELAQLKLSTVEKLACPSGKLSR